MTLHGGTWAAIPQPPWDPYDDETLPGGMIEPIGSKAMFHLMMDATVIVDNGHTWLRLHPDREGSYLDGHWTRIARRPHQELYYASAVLADGRLVCAFGEFDGYADAEWAFDVYNSALDEWTTYDPDWDITTDLDRTWQDDVPLVPLADGRLLVCTGLSSGPGDLRLHSAIFDPITNTMTETDGTLYQTLETGLSLRHDGTVLNYVGDGVGDLGAALYDLNTETWTATATPPNVQAIVDAVDVLVYDMGKLLLLANGNVMQLGNLDGKTAVFSAAGSWSLGPTMPTLTGQTLPAGAMDQPAVVMCNGNVLAAIGEYLPGAAWNGPCKWAECDGTTWGELANQPTALTSSFSDHAIPLPNGQVLASTGHRKIWLFTPASVTPPATSAPVLDDITTAGGTPTTSLFPGTTYIVEGTRLNGVILGAGNKDENSCNSNFPIVRLEYGDGTIIYCPTRNPRLQSDESTYLGVSPSAATKADFTVPSNVPAGSADLVVVASGMPSAATAVTIAATGSAYLEPLVVTGGFGGNWSGFFDSELTKYYPLEGTNTPDPASSEYLTPSVTASGGVAPYSYALHSDSDLPAGVTFHSDATGAWLEGYPTDVEWPYQDAVAQQRTFITVIATDALGATGEGHFLAYSLDHAPVAFIGDDVGFDDTVGVTGEGFAGFSDNSHLADAVVTQGEHAVDLSKRYARLI